MKQRDYLTKNNDFVMSCFVGHPVCEMVIDKAKFTE